MEPFRGQYPDTSYSPAYPPPPGSEPMNYTYAPANPTPNTTSSKPFFSSQAYSAPPYDPQNTQTRRTWRWKFRNISSNFWLWEAFAILITLAIAAAIGHQLKKLDGRSTYYWTWVWSPTSVLALGVTIAKAAMMVPVASALGQLKWHRYKRAQKLDGLEKFDDASRGVIGSLKLLWELKCWHIASIGALITVCALSLDSLTQNAVRIALVPDFTYDDSWVHRTGRFEAVSYFRQRSKDLPSSNMLPPLYYAISATEAPAFDQSLAHCESVNCTYGTYDSLAVDYQCIPSKAERSGSAYLHSGMKDTSFFLDGTDIIKSNTTLAPPPSGSYKDLGPLIARWLVLLNPSTQRPAPTAMECAFYWTVKKYHGETVNGVFHETALATYTNASSPGTLKQDIYITPGECWRNNRSVPVTTQNCTNVVGYPSHASLQSWFTLDDFGVRGYAANDTRRGDAEEFWDYSSIFMQSIMSKLVDMNATAVASTINDTADALATTMTATIRQMAETYSSAGNTYGIVNGTTEWPPMVVYVIAWKYLVVPALIVALSALFFVATVVFTWGEGGWKSSQLALVFHGLGDTDVRAAGDVREYADMREVGRGMRVRLVDGVDGRRLVSEKAMGA